MAKARPRRTQTILSKAELLRPDFPLAARDGTSTRLPASKGRANRIAMANTGPMSLHQLRIFWAVAHSDSLTKASKLLGLTQPSLSQHLAKLEKSLGTRVFKRGGSKLELTDAGAFLMRRAELILAEVDETQAGLRQFATGEHGSISIGAPNSIARLLVPSVYAKVAKQYSALDIDVHEVAPAEAINLLYGRRLHIALIARASIAGASLSFHQSEIISDPYVLAVPKGLSLGGISDPERELAEPERRILNSCIQFSFGTLHTQRVAEWYRRTLPRHRLVAQTRTYDMALSLVEAGVGVALVPALAAYIGQDSLPFAVTLYRTHLPGRSIVALMPTQYVRAQPYAAFREALIDAGKRIGTPPTEPTPPFMPREVKDN
ncbi:MAG: LysR family transcriptional regulator [Alphaproteobacteria bacterium]|nr:LysR family transcriptional regulator [Alphaproteobacteria bacterium]